MPPISNTADLQSYIEVMSLYREDTYTYRKYCPTYIVEYGANGIQIIKGPCTYGGIKDFGAYLTAVADTTSTYSDLSAYIKQIYESTADVGAFVDTRIVEQSDLSAYVDTYYESYTDLLAQILGLKNKDVSDIIGSVYGIGPVDLYASLYAIQQSVKNLSANVVVDQYKLYVNLAATVYKIKQVDLSNFGAYISSSSTVIDLSAYTKAIYYRDFSGYLVPAYLKDLSAYIYGVPSLDLYGNIYGWAPRDLQATIRSRYSPYDLFAYLNPVPSVNLSAFIKVFKEIDSINDLSARIDSFNSSDLAAYINAVSFVNLPGYLNAVGKTIDLYAYIFPMTIHIRKILNISLLDHLNLRAVVNSICYSSSNSDLGAYVYALMRSDLRGYIIGWRTDNTTDGLSDFNAYINTEDYFVEDTINVNITPFAKYIQLNVSDFVVSPYYTMDTLRVSVNSYSNVNLNAYINGIFEVLDLSATITPTRDYPHITIPSTERMKVKETLINLERFEEREQRTVQIYFDSNSSDNFYYFYVGGNDTLYKVDKDSGWSIKVTGYTKTLGSIVEKINLTHKTAYNIGAYDNVDAVIRDLIDKAAFPRRASLGAYISGILPPHSDLHASVDNIKYYKHWIKYLNGYIQVIGVQHSEFPAQIAGFNVFGFDSLQASLSCIQPYIPVDGDSIVFEFLAADAGYIPNDYNELDYEFDT